jgi:mitogen-activated protein kinase kinase kinase
MNKPIVVNGPEPAADSSGSGSSADSDQDPMLGRHHGSLDNSDEAQYRFAPSVVTTPIEEGAPLAQAGSYAWNTAGQTRSRALPMSSGGRPSVTAEKPTQTQTNGLTATGRATRPAAVRTPSNTYAPARRPQQFSLDTTGRHRHSSSSRAGRRNPNAEYRAQEKAYVQRIRQENEQDDFFGDMRTPSLGYSSESDSDDESPSTGDYVDRDYDQETLLYYGNNDMQPSVEELKIPENRERLEWHSMLANVLTGDVVKQEKKRLIGSTEQQGDNSLKAEIWLAIRAKVCGRSMQAQRRLVDDGRATIKPQIESIIAFEVKGEAEAGQSAAAQVEEIVRQIGKVESLYPTRLALEAAHPRAAAQAYKDSCDAVFAWHNTTELINTEMSILKKWVGNDELDFSKAPARTSQDPHLTDDSSFIDRILKEDGLKSLQGDTSLLESLERVIYKAKATLIANAEAFADRHLPPYIEELLTLINFPSRLVQEIIKMRLSYAKKIKDPSQRGIMMAEQMIAQFQILLTLAGKIKQSYLRISHPEPGWELPVCIEENFDQTVLDALKFYFRMLNWKLSANKNTFKEAEILEQEWEFSNKLGRHFEGGDVEVAEQFRYVCSVRSDFEALLIRLQFFDL